MPVWLQVAKIRKWAILPERAHEVDAGMDMFYCPNDPPPQPGQVSGNLRFVSIDPGGSVLIPTGIKTHVPKGYMLEIKNKSGIATKRKLLVGACVVDSGYSNEVFINLHNLNRDKVEIINPGDKVAQAVLVPIASCIVQETTQENIDSLNKEVSERGGGGFGSTGDKQKATNKFDDHGLL